MRITWPRVQARPKPSARMGGHRGPHAAARPFAFGGSMQLAKSGQLLGALALAAALRSIHSHLQALSATQKAHNQLSTTEDRIENVEAVLQATMDHVSELLKTYPEKAVSKERLELLERRLKGLEDERSVVFDILKQLRTDIDAGGEDDVETDDTIPARRRRRTDSE
jgi:hypothetical protein